MKPATFEYLTPHSVDEAVALLERYGDDAKVLAGGQSLVPLMNFRLARPSYVLDMGRIAGLAYIQEDGDHLCIGALTCQAAIEESPLVATRCPLLHEATKLIGHAPIRHRGTIGGSLAHADPAAEYPAAFVALDGEVVVQGVNGKRIIPAAELFLTFFTTSLAPDEILTEIRVPTTNGSSGWAFEELNRRHGDYAIVGVACGITTDSAGACDDARIALAGVGPTPIRCVGAEAVLQGSVINDDVLDEAAASAEAEAEPEGDVHGTAEYKRAMVRVLSWRALMQSLDRCRRDVDAARD